MAKVSALYLADIKRILSLPLPWQALDGASVVVTGAGGMVGSVIVHVLSLLAETHGVRCSVTAVSRDADRLRSLLDSRGVPQTVRCVGQDLLLPLGAELTGTPADYVLHLASATHPAQYASSPVQVLMLGTFGTYSVLQYAAEQKARRFLYASSVEIYGESHSRIPFSEGDMGFIDCNTPRACYPESKRAGESLCRAFMAQYGLECVIPRLCRVYGPTLRSDDTKALSCFIRNAVRSEPVVLASDGTQLYSFIHASDAAGALLYCLLGGEDGAAYNVASPDSTVTLGEAATLCARIAGTRVLRRDTQSVQKGGSSPVTYAVLDAAKISALGWTPFWSIADGLSQTVSALREVWA